MTQKEKVKVSFSISLTKTYTLDEIAGWEELCPLLSDDLKTTLLSMIQYDVINAIGDGKGKFKIIG